MKKEATPKIGIKDIAKKADVSIGTVDRVLHNRSEVSKTTREQVLKIIEELGYTPNLLAKSLASKVKYTIAVLIPDPNSNAYWEKPLEGIKAAAREIKKFNFELQVATFDYSSENSFFEKANEILESNPSGFIFAPVYYDSSLRVMERCDQMQLPYVFFDVFIENCNNLAYFGQNSVQSGYLAARLMRYSLYSEINHIYIVKPLNPSAPVYHLSLREKGFTSFFSEETSNQATIHSMDVDISSPSILIDSLDTIFGSGQKPGGLFVANSRVHLVAKYFETKQIKDVVLIGYDLLHENIEYLEKGIIQFLICQKPEEQGYKSVFSLFNHLFLKKTNVEKLNYSPIDIIMKENIEYYKNFKI